MRSLAGLLVLALVGAVLYLDASNRAMTYEIANDALSLLDASGTALARFE